MKLRGQYETVLEPKDPRPGRQRWTRPLNSAAARGLRVSFDPSGNGIGCWNSCATGAMLSPWLHRSRGLPPLWRCSCRTADRRLFADCFAPALHTLPQSRYTARNYVRHLRAFGSEFSFLLCRVKWQAPAVPFMPCSKKRTGRRQILSSPTGDLISWSYLRPVLTQDIFTFHCRCRECSSTVIVKVLSKLRKRKGAIRPPSSNSALS